MKLVDWKNLNAEQKYVWNKAIEAAALKAAEAGEFITTEEIRRLKK